MNRDEFWQLAYLAALNNCTLEAAFDRCDFAESVANLAVLDWDNFQSGQQKQDK